MFSQKVCITVIKIEPYGGAGKNFSYLPNPFAIQNAGNV